MTDEKLLKFIGDKILSIEIIGDEEGVQIITDHGRFTVSAAPIGFINSYVCVEQIERIELGPEGA